MVYPYLLLSLIFASAWLIFFIKRKNLRKKLLISSIFAVPLGLTEFLFIPTYWQPRFNVIHISNELFVESLLFTFFFAGIGAIFYQSIYNKEYFKIKISPFYLLISPSLFLLYFLSRFVFQFQINIMYFVISSLLIGSIIALIKFRITVIKSIILNTMIFTMFYVLAIVIISLIFKEWSQSYNIKSFVPFLIAGVPLEEFFWAFSFTLYWAPFYEIIKNNTKLFS